MGHAHGRCRVEAEGFFDDGLDVYQIVDVGGLYGPSSADFGV
ncbi:hypothetical protein LINPERPRIM_LOCUS39454 [Linum perenne]